MKPSANKAASVRQRLLNRAKSDKRPFNDLLQYIREKQVQWMAFFMKKEKNSWPKGKKE